MRFLSETSMPIVFGILISGFSWMSCSGPLPSICLAVESPSAGDEFLTAGVQAERQGNVVAAEAAYERCLRFATENNVPKLQGPALHRLAVLNAKQGRQDESEKYFRQAIRHDGGNVAILCDFAKLFSDRKNYTDAETILKNAVLLAPDNRRALFNLGHVVASQPDRSTEGLRYLKHALGEAGAYREIAKICRNAGNENQAEFAEQRAAILERTETQPTAEALATPTVPMDERTKNELVEHIKQELLKLETAEIADEQQKEMAKVVQAEPTVSMPTVVANVENSSGRAVESASVRDPFLDGNAVDRAALAEPKIEPAIMPEIVAGPVPVLEPNIPLKTEATIDPFLAAAPATDPTVVEVPESAKVKVIPEVDSVAVSSMPRIVPLEKTPVLPLPQSTETAGPADIKTLPKAPEKEKTLKSLRSLPEPESRISNSQDAVAVKQDAGAENRLPALVLPLDDSPGDNDLPEYTAIGIKRIPSTQKKAFSPSPEKAPKFVSDGADFVADPSSPVMNFSLAQSGDNTENLPENTAENIGSADAFSSSPATVSSHPPLLAQPVNLISMESRAPAPRKPSMPSNVSRQRTESLPPDSIRRLESRPADRISTQNVPFPESKAGIESSDLDRQVQEKSVLRPGAGKNWDREAVEDYVYVEQEAAEREAAPKQEAASARPDGNEGKIPAKIRPLQSDDPSSRYADMTRSGIKRTPSTVENPLGRTDSPMRDFRVEMPRIVPEEIVPKEVVATPLMPEVSTEPLPETTLSEPLPEPVPEPENRSELQFSSMVAPNVLKFEIAREKTDADLMPMPEPIVESASAFQPPTVLKFAPVRMPVPQTEPKPEMVASKPNPAPEVLISKAPVETPPQRPDPFMPNFPILKAEAPVEPVPEPLTPVANESVRELAVTKAPLQFKPEPLPQTSNRPVPETVVDVAKIRTIPMENPVRAPQPRWKAPDVLPDVSTEKLPQTVDEPQIARIMEKPVMERTVEPIVPKLPPMPEPKIETPAVAVKPAARPEPVQKEDMTLQELSRQFASAPSYERIESNRSLPVVSREKTDVPKTDDSVGFARTRKTSPPRTVRMEDSVETLLTPQDSLAEHPIFSKKESDETASEAGFARSGKYSGAPLQ